MPSSMRVRRADFPVSNRQVRRLAGTYVSLSVSPNTEGLKAACVVSKKISKSAVLRNRIKRRCREIVRTSIADTSKPLTLVLYAKKEASTADFNALQRDIRALLSKITTLSD